MADYFELRERTFCDRKIRRITWGMLFNDACRPSSGLRRLTLREVSGVMDTGHPDFVNRRPLLRITDRQKWHYLMTNLNRRLRLRGRLRLRDRLRLRSRLIRLGVLLKSLANKLKPPDAG